MINQLLLNLKLQLILLKQEKNKQMKNNVKPLTLPTAAPKLAPPVMQAPPSLPPPQMPPAPVSLPPPV